MFEVRVSSTPRLSQGLVFTLFGMKALFLKEKLHNALHNLKSVSVRYNNLEANAQVQLEIQQEMRSKLEQCHSHMKTLKSELQVVQKEKDAAILMAKKAEEHREQVQDLIEENKLLEDNLSQLCELPFVRDSPHDQDLASEMMEEEQVIELQTTNNEFRQQLMIMNLEKQKFEHIVSDTGKENEQLRSECEDLKLQLRIKHQSGMKRSTSEKYVQTFMESSTKLLLNSIQTQTLNVLVQKEEKTTQTNIVHDCRYSSEENLFTPDSNGCNDTTKVPILVANVEATHSETANQIDEDKIQSSIRAIQISINDAELNHDFIASHDATMIVLEFLNFGTTASYQCIGTEPKYDFFVNYELDEQNRKHLNGSQVYVELYRIRSPQDFEPIATSVFSPTEIRQDTEQTLRLHFYSNTDADAVVGIVDVLVQFIKIGPNEDASNNNINCNETKEEKNNSDSEYSNVDDENKTVQKHLTTDDTLSNLIHYFETDGEINYFDFLRFVDPPYPILFQIEHLESKSVQLNNALKNDDLQSHDGFTSEDAFVSAINTLCDDKLALYDIHELYRHIKGDGTGIVTRQRILHFLYSSDVIAIRNLFNSFRKTSVNPWNPFKIADLQRRGFVGKNTFIECLRSIGIEASL